MQNTNYTLIPTEDLKNLKSRIHNQRKTLARQHNEIKGLKDTVTDNAEEAIAYEYTIEDLVDKHNKLAKEADDLQELRVKHERQLVAVNHAINGKLHVALR